MPGPLVRHRFLDCADQILIGSARAEDGAQIGLLQGEQTGAKLAFCGKAHTIAITTERLRDARYYANVTAAVRVSVNGGGLNMPTIRGAG